MSEYGYLSRTSINERDDRDIVSIFGVVPGEHVVVEQAWSNGERSRPAFEKMIDKLMPGDVLYISSIDRLGIDATDAVTLWNYITKEKSTDIIVLNDDLLNSRENRKLSAKQLTASAKAAYTALEASLNQLK